MSLFSKKHETEEERKRREQRLICEWLLDLQLQEDEARFVRLMQQRLLAGLPLHDAHAQRLMKLEADLHYESGW